VLATRGRAPRAGIAYGVVDVTWKVAVIDSCGRWPGALEAAAFSSVGDAVTLLPVSEDPTGHGSAITELLATSGQSVDMLLAQVFTRPGATTAAAVGAAITWSVARGARLIHLSLGLRADRPVLSSAVANAVNSGCILVASTPARGGPVYPAAYTGVISATGDARCAPGEWAVLDDGSFAGHLGDLHGRTLAAVRGASIGAAWISRAILGLPCETSASLAIAALVARATYRGRERRGALPVERT